MGEPTAERLRRRSSEVSAQAASSFAGADEAGASGTIPRSPYVTGWRGYAVAVLSALGALGLQWGFKGIIDGAGFVFFAGAVGWVGYSAGLAPALLAAFISVPLAQYFVLQPVAPLSPPLDALRLVILLTIATGIGWIGSRRRIFLHEREHLLKQRLAAQAQRAGVEQELKAQRELLETVFDRIPVMLCIFDPSQQRFRFNRHLREILGWTEADANDGDFMAKAYPDPEYRQEVAEYMQSLAPGWRDLKTTAKNGEEVNCSWANVRLSDDTSIGIAVDARERKRAEAALRESEERLRLALGAARMTAWDYDPATRNVTFYGNAEQVLELPRRHETSEQGYNLLHPDDVERHRALVNEAIATGGRYISVYRHAHGSPEIWLEEHGSAVVDPAGKTTRLVGVVQNITDRKQAEAQLEAMNEDLERRVQERTAQLEQSYEALRHAERLAAIGQMVTVLSHESRNALQNLQAALQMIGRTSDPSRQQRYLNAALKSLEDLKQTHDEVRDFAAPVRLECTHTRLDALWREAWEDLAAVRGGRNAQLREVGSGWECTCEVDPYRLKQVFRNLMENSLAACADPVEIEIACTDARKDGQAAVVVTLRDNGPGVVDPKELPRLTEPFYTTKPKGTGLGLSVVQRTIEAHGGAVEIRCEPGQGFEVSLLLRRKMP